MKIVVADPNFSPHRQAFEESIPADWEVAWHHLDDPDLLPALAEADVFVGGRFDQATSDAAPRLRLVHSPGAGIDGIDVTALRNGTAFANTFHHEDSMAEYVVAMAILLRRGLLQQDQQLRRGRWASSLYDAAIGQPSNLTGDTVGFIGFGHIGRRSWELLRPFAGRGIAVTGTGRVDAEAAGLGWASSIDGLDRLLAESDIVVVSAPLSPATRGLLGADQFKQLKQQAVVINVGRGPLLDEEAFFHALSRQKIGGAAIDVWYDYPGADGQGLPSRFPFHELPNVVMTPHSSGITRQTFLRRLDDITENIHRLLRGEKLINEIQPGGEAR